MKKKAEWIRKAVWNFLAETSLLCREWNQISRSSSPYAHYAISVAVKYARTIKMLHLLLLLLL